MWNFSLQQKAARQGRLAFRGRGKAVEFPFRRINGFVLAAAIGSAALTASAVQAADRLEAGKAAKTAALAVAKAPLAPPLAEGLSPVLSGADVARYRKIFAVQEKGGWKAADNLIAKLEDRVLMGHVMAQRFLHPTKYRSRYKELKKWLANYNDHPDAGRLYKIALRRRPVNWRMPKRPLNTFLNIATEDQAAQRPVGKRGLSRKQRRQVRAWKHQIKSALRKGWTKSAKGLIQSKGLQNLFSVSEVDWAKARLAFGYFVDGRDDWALDWANQAAHRSSARVPEAHWTAGLAAWRLGLLDEAAQHFETLAAKKDLTPWLKSAAAFWAARSHLVAGRPDRVNGFLVQAAAAPRTFYGILAGHMLGIRPAFRWATPPLEQIALDRLMKTKSGRRTVALLQVGEYRRAERDLRGLASRSKPNDAKGILAFAARANMPSLSVRLNDQMFPNGGGFDGAAYPVPDWEPRGGFRVDRALIYALIRQESRFNPKAKSGAGARGLMQLMPGTASFVARDRRFRWGKRRKLFMPEVNLSLGQKYIEILLKEKNIGGDLFRLAAAWNGGPGNLRKWRRRVDDLGDPLFFIESLPSRETRIFIERVIANLWIYRDRLGQETPSLDALASGAWPVYRPVEGVQVAEDGQN